MCEHFHSTQQHRTQTDPLILSVSGSKPNVQAITYLLLCIPLLRCHNNRRIWDKPENLEGKMGVSENKSNPEVSQHSNFVCTHEKATIKAAISYLLTLYNTYVYH